MFLFVSVRNAGVHPGEHRHGVSIQISISLGKTSLRISRIPTLHEKMDLQQLQNQCKYEVNTTFDQICSYLPRGKFHRWIIFAREAKMVNTAFTQSLQSKANEKKNCTFASDLT